MFCLIGATEKRKKGERKKKKEKTQMNEWKKGSEQGETLKKLIKEKRKRRSRYNGEGNALWSRLKLLRERARKRA